MPGIIAIGDWSYYPREYLSDLLTFPLCWTTRFFTGPVFMLYDWPLQLVMGFVAHMGFDFGVAERVVYLFPYLVMSILGSYYFTYILFRKHTICFFSTLFFIFNIPTLQLLLFDRLFAYALMPLILAFFIKGNREGTLASYLICGALLTVCTFYEPRVAYLAALPMIMFFINHIAGLIIDKKSKFFKNLAMSFVHLGVVFVVPLIMNFYWIYPTLVSKSTYMISGYASSGWVKALSYFKLSHCLAVYTPSWPPGSTGFQQVRLIYYLLPILVFMAIVFRRKNGNVRTLTLLALISVFLTKGSNPPLGNVYIWLFKHIAGFDAFRDPGKFYMLICLAYAPLLGVSIDAITSKIRKINIIKIRLIRKKIYQLPLVQILMVIILIYLILPAITGKMKYKFIGNPIPNEYKTTEKFINSQTDIFRTFWRPHNDQFSYYSQKHPLVRAHYSLNSTHFFLSDIWNPDAFKQRKDMAKILGLLNIKYAFIPQETVNLWGISKDFFISTFNNQDGLEKIDIGENIDIFENKYFYPRFFATSQGALVVGGRKAIFHLASLGKMDFSSWAIFFADEQRSSNVYLLNYVDSVVFSNKGLDDFILASVSENYRMDLSNFGINPDNPTPGKWQKVEVSPLDSYGNFYGEISHNRSTAIYANPDREIELSTPIPIEIKKDDTFELWVRAATGPEMGKLNAKMSKTTDLFNERFIYYDDFDTDKWKNDAYYYKGFHKDNIQFHGGVLGTSSEQGEKTAELVYRINSQSPIRSMWIEWDTFILNPNRVGKLFISDNSKEWTQVGETLTSDIHPCRVDISDYVSGRKEYFIKYQFEIKPDNWGGGPSLLRIGYYFDTFSVSDVLINKDLRNENHAFQWVKMDSLYLEKGQYYLNITNNEGKGMLDQLVIVPKGIMDILRKKILKSLNQKNIILIFDDERSFSNIHIPLNGLYRMTFEIDNHNFSGSINIILNGHKIKEKKLSHDEKSIWVETGPTNLNEGRSQVNISKQGIGEVKVKKIILYKAIFSVYSIKELFKTNEKIPVDWKMINPTKYEVKVTTKKPTYLIFSEAYNPNWRLKINPPVSSISAYSLINSFLIAQPGDFNAIIEFSPQKYVYKGLWVSGFGLTLICIYFLFRGRYLISHRHKQKLHKI